MLEITQSNKNQWCDKCRRMIPKGYEFWAGTSVTMVGIVPVVEYVQEHKDCEKMKDQPLKELTICES